MSKTAVPPAYRWAVASRVAAAALGGYALTSAVTIVLTLLWPAPKVEAVLMATMCSFTVYTVVVIWAFTTRSATRAWAGLLACAAAVAGVAWLLHKGGVA